VVAVQVKSIQDAIREKKTRFNFQGEDIRLIWTVGLFITMNPGYAGRTELPENLKALFRYECFFCIYIPCINQLLVGISYKKIGYLSLFFFSFNKM